MTDLDPIMQAAERLDDAEPLYTTNATGNFPPITMESLEEMKRRFDELPKIERRELTHEEMVFVEIGIGLGLIEVRKAESWQDYAVASVLGFTCPRPPSQYLPSPLARLRH